MHKLIILTFLIFSCFTACFSQSSIPDQKDFLRQAEDLAMKLAGEDKYSGTFLIAKEGEPVLTRSYGLADKDTKVPNNADTIYNLGSINKIFTALAIGILADEGKLSLDDTIGKHLPGYPNKDAREKATIRQLLSMTSGIGDIFGPEYDATPKTRLRSIDSYLPLFASKPLEFEPGSDRRYSNGGFLVLGAIIEKASGQSYYDFVRSKIFLPLEMKDTDSYEVDSQKAGIAKGYTRPEGSKAERTRNLDSLPGRGSSGGGGYSTAADLLKFVNALDSGKLKVPESLRKADGVMIARMLSKGLGIAGGAPGINAVIESKMRGGYTLIVLSNYDPPSAIELGREIRKMLGQPD